MVPFLFATTLMGFQGLASRSSGLKQHGSAYIVGTFQLLLTRSSLGVAQGNRIRDYLSPIDALRLAVLWQK